MQIYGPDQRTPTQWMKFLSEGTNKAAFVKFLFVAWKNADLTGAGNNITHRDRCHCVTVMEGEQLNMFGLLRYLHLK